MMDKVFPDDLLNVILDTTLQRHGIEVDKMKLESSNIEALRKTSLELLGRVDEFLKRSKVEEATVEPDEIEQVEQVEESVESERIEQVEKTVEVTPKPIRRSFWGQL